MTQLLRNTIFSTYVSRWMVLLVDISFTMLTFISAYLIRFNFSLDFDTDQFLYQQPVICVLAILSYYSVGSYKGILRYTGIKDAINVFKGVSLLSFLEITIVLFNRTFNVFEGFSIPLSIIVIHFLLTITVLISTRFIYKFIFNNVITKLDFPSKILIYGAGNLGQITYAALAKDKHQLDNIVGFIDDDINKDGRVIDGIKIYKLNKINKFFIKKNEVKEVIIAIHNILPSRLMEITKYFLIYDIKIKAIPPVRKWIDGNLQVGQIKQIKIEDLLSRDIIKIDNSKLQNEFKNKIILITGAAGSIGSEISQQIAQYKFAHLVLVDQAESALYDVQQEFKHLGITKTSIILADIRDKKRMDQIFEAYRPEIVFHAAAYKHVPLMEENPYEATGVNILGTSIIMDLSVKYKIDKFIMVSTDKAVNPTNVMGATKRVAEKYACCLNAKNKTKFIITRFGNVLGSNGSVIPLFKKQISNGGPITVTHKEITRFFMTIPEACQLVLEAGTMGHGGEIYVFDMGESVKIFDLAVKMIHLSNLRYPEDIDIKISGLRPGEKLFEELLTDKENTQPTYHDKIMIANSEKFNCNLLNAKIDYLNANFRLMEDYEIVTKIKQIVPEYISNNSIYENLDQIKAVNGEERIKLEIAKENEIRVRRYKSKIHSNK